MESIEGQKATIKMSLVLKIDSKKTMAKQEDDAVPMKFQNLMQSIPMYDGSQKQSIRDFFDSIENRAELGGSLDEQKVREA